MQQLICTGTRNAAVQGRELPDRLAVSLSLRQPVLEVRDVAGDPRFVLDRRGVCLPPIADATLPFTVVRGPWFEPLREPVVGRIHPDPRVLAALDVALTWRDEVAPALGTDLLPLIEVDAFNLDGLQLSGARDPEVRVFVRGAQADAPLRP